MCSLWEKLLLVHFSCGADCPGGLAGLFGLREKIGVCRSLSKSVVMLPVQETWQAMEKLVDEGLVKSIGISNFSVEKIKVCHTCHASFELASLTALHSQPLCKLSCIMWTHVCLLIALRDLYYEH